MKLFFSIVLVITGCLATHAQTPQALSSADILLGLKKLNVLGSVLYVAAHPDDENTRLLAYFSKEKLYRTGYLSFTRGDGGQNLIGNEQGVELGLIRTQELLAARRIDGAEQFFSRAYDFGFSKSTEEALRIWDRNKVLSDAVWVIRKFQPDVIITRFPKDSRAGHGHHSASAVLAEEAYLAAADPSKFPEQLKYVKPWKAKRLLWNTFNFGSANTQSDDQFKMDVGAFNPLLGKGYGEIAAESRSQHKSQGFGVARQRGPAIEYFVTWQGDTPEKELMENINTSWTRVKDGAVIQKKVESIISNFSMSHPGKSVKDLTVLYKMIGASENSYWREQKLKEVAGLIEACSGLWVDATTETELAVRNERVKINFSLNNRNGNAVSVKRISMEGFDTTLNNNLASNQNLLFSKSVYVDASLPLSQPYWLENPMKPGYFDVTDQQLIGNADSKPAFTARFSMNIEGLDIELTKPVRYKFTDPVKGELYQPVVIVPKDIRKEQQLTANIHLKIVSPTAKTGKQSASEVMYGAPQLVLRNISYEHIPELSYFRMDSVKVIELDLKTEGRKIGYIEGAGDKVVAALQQMGYEVTVLSDKELDVTDLSQFQAIITGVRAYNVRESLNNYYDKLMKYVEQGGNLIAQYNTSSQIGPVRAKIGPYPFTISRTRITDEEAKVRILKPDHQLLNYPNKITDKDFEGWVQERSIYHAQGWDNHYETIFAMRDPGENEDEGSLIMTKYGKGTFVYTGLVFFRELPAGVPGAYRLLANLIALNNKTAL